MPEPSPEVVARLRAMHANPDQLTRYGELLTWVPEPTRSTIEDALDAVLALLPEVGQAPEPETRCGECGGRLEPASRCTDCLTWHGPAPHHTHEETP